MSATRLTWRSPWPDGVRARTSVHRAAADRNLPIAGYYAAVSGPAGDQPLPSAWTWDDVHPSAAGAEQLAAVMADLGYDPLAPAGD
jgi:lysophospholipase L1-like esterase